MAVTVWRIAREDDEVPHAYPEPGFDWTPSLCGGSRCVPWAVEVNPEAEDVICERCLDAELAAFEHRAIIAIRELSIRLPGAA